MSSSSDGALKHAIIPVARCLTRPQLPVLMFNLYASGGRGGERDQKSRRLNVFVTSTCCARAAPAADADRYIIRVVKQWWVMVVAVRGLWIYDAAIVKAVGIA